MMLQLVLPRQRWILLWLLRPLQRHLSLLLLLLTPRLDLWSIQRIDDWWLLCNRPNFRFGRQNLGPFFDFYSPRTASRARDAQRDLDPTLDRRVATRDRTRSRGS